MQEELLENLSKINGAHTVVLNFRNLFYIDVDGLDSLKEIIETKLKNDPMNSVLVAGLQYVLSLFSPSPDSKEI